jgi:hypothetical protein
VKGGHIQTRIPESIARRGDDIGERPVRIRQDIGRARLADAEHIAHFVSHSSAAACSAAIDADRKLCHLILRMSLFPCFLIPYQKNTIYQVAMQFFFRNFNTLILNDKIIV